MSTQWPAEATDIIGGDLLACFATTTPMGGTTLVPVCPFGMHDAAQGIVTLSSPVVMCGKLARLLDNPRCALAFFSRDHGLGSTPGFVLVQGNAELHREATPEFIDEMHEAWPKFLPPIPISGWKRRAGRAYYDWRVPVRIHVERLTYWASPSATGDATVAGTARPTTDPPAQDPPAKGTSTRVRASKWRKSFERSPHRLIGYVGADGYPVVVPVDVTASEEGLEVAHPDLPVGGRRAGYFGFWFERQLAGQGGLLTTGWLDGADDGRGTYTIHTRTAFDLPRSLISPKTLVPLGCGFEHRQAQRKRLVDGGTWLGGPP